MRPRYLDPSYEYHDLFGLRYSIKLRCNGTLVELPQNSGQNLNNCCIQARVREIRYDNTER
jgi:hypothetical protein